MVALGASVDNATIHSRDVDKATIYELVYEKKGNSILLASIELFNNPPQRKEEIIQFVLWKAAIESLMDCVKKMEPIPKQN